ncbi:hypothetical protein DPMN_071769 [Dreissena polymorpha]|uniref:Uncharacterized protein n=1 Tax=Dreissena polymorpha TaxID=45954 RepID=A0A9D3Z7K6_DREPO|nr:hypothetical protein DPMN_071769 [Dreissena polymorpha]
MYIFHFTDPASRQAIIDAACNNNNNKVSHVPVNASSPTNECMEDGPDKSCQGTSEVNNNLLYNCEIFKDIGETN